ncbi:hypothetical protein GALL_526350 [mine drainage metagenome]|uniref:Uncharacterized protein n=1 Tax=mine drainage metagenome TaxID=410659 RepID=A0A1J5PE55_9ZZZZ
MSKTIIRISLSLVVVAALVFALLNVFSSNRNSRSVSASPHPSTSTNTSPPIPDVLGMPVVPVDAIPTVGGHVWRIVNDSNKELARCLTSERINFVGIHTLEYANDIPGAQASVSWITGSNAPSGYFTSAIQQCTIGADQPRDLTELTPDDSVTSPTSETMATNGSLRSYATGTSINGTMLVAFWTQPGAPVISPSPANAIAFRAVALYKLAALGVMNPEVVACKMVAERPIVKTPPEVAALIKAKYADLAPVTILSKYTGAVDVRAESVTPHICVYSDGRQVEYSGKVPTSATEAIVVGVQHASRPLTGGTDSFVTAAKIPTSGWVIVDAWG